VDDPTDGPLEVGPEKELDPLLLSALATLSKPGSMLFTVKPGSAGALMTKSGHCQKIPPAWMKQLVRRALIDQPVGQGNKVACMNWIQYTLTYEGQQVLNRRR
jgi:hypothetical protein